MNGNGKERRDEGINRVVSNTPAEYRDSFYKACYAVLAERNYLTSEDITKRCGMPPNHSNAVGGLMFGLVQAGILEPFDDAKSVVPTSHAARLRLYRRAKF